jgi:hypothetical protein
MTDQETEERGRRQRTNRPLPNNTETKQADNAKKFPKKWREKRRAVTTTTSIGCKG